MTFAGTERRGTGALLDRLDAALPSPSPNERSRLGQLRELSDRMSRDRLQLAVVGQFKRGKSTLINALLGAELLPSGILPVTAIPTFIESGEPSLTINYADGRFEKIDVAGADEMQVALHRFVSENGNPGNERSVRDVWVTWPSAFLEAGVTIIDTPGVGSTLEHNSRAAEAALPQADVALFILSSDPPITRVETDYLAAVEAHAVRTIILLNKCDLVSDAERSEAIGFIHQVIGVPADQILCLSARRAIEALRAGDGQDQQSSGLAELQDRLADFLAREKQPALHQAFAKKAVRILDDLRLESQVVLRSLELSVEELANRADALSARMRDIGAERSRAADLLAGDRKRTIAELSAQAAKIAERAGAALLPELARRIAAGKSPDAIAQELLDRLPPMFAGEFASTRDWLADHVRKLFEGHVAEADRLLAAIRSAAAQALSIEITGPLSGISTEFDVAPAWYAQRVETLIPVPNGAIERLLPRTMRHRRGTARIARELELAINRNVEALRWSLIQASEQAFRRFARELHETLNSAEAATADAVSTVLSRRRDQSAALSPEIEARSKLIEQLTAALHGLAGQFLSVAPTPPADEFRGQPQPSRSEKNGDTSPDVRA